MPLYSPPITLTKSVSGMQRAQTAKTNKNSKTSAVLSGNTAAAITFKNYQTGINKKMMAAD